jgi:glutaredoxin-like YruB-family protein
MNVKIYTTPTCPYCKLTKDFFKENGIEYTEVDVAADSAAANEMVKLSGQMGVPVIDIDGQIIVGWNKSALEEALGLKQKSKQAA